MLGYTFCSEKYTTRILLLLSAAFVGIGLIPTQTNVIIIAVIYETSFFIAIPSSLNCYTAIAKPLLYSVTVIR